MISDRRLLSEDYCVLKGGSVIIWSFGNLFFMHDEVIKDDVHPFAQQFTRSDVQADNFVTR